MLNLLRCDGLRGEADSEVLMARKKWHHDQIREAVNDIALVDSHAHNLVELTSSFSFIHTFGEAGADALADIPHTIPFKRGVEDVAQLYEIDASLANIEEHRKRVGLKALGVKCFKAANIDVLLLDDGLALEEMKDLSWHEHFVNKVYRVLRIEAVAEEILKNGPPPGLNNWNFNVFEEQFVSTLKSLLPSVVSFKSIAAYRSGLNINPNVSVEDAEEGLRRDLDLALSGKKPLRLQNKNVIDLLFIRALEVATSHGIPMQIHTGFGDKDLDLRLANPLHLRSVLEDKRFATARLVLLHASYPYMREATYLSSVYTQVFLDFGLAIPKLTVRGMRTTVAELLELAPINKVMFSTDGYAFPETYFLGAKWARTILEQYLCEAYDDGDLTVEQAVGAAEALLRKNSLAFYKLEGSDEKVDKSRAHSRASTRTEKSLVSTACLDNVKYVRLLWADGSGQRRCRVVPSARYKAVVVENGVGLTKACMGMSSHSDGPAIESGLSAVGEIRLIPDQTTVHSLPRWEHGVVLVDMHEKPGTPWEYCPRSTLRRLTDLLDKEFGLVLRAGFETEFYLLKNTNEADKYEGVDCTSYCSTNALNQSLPTINSILTLLGSLDVDIEQFHAEAGGGQFEICLAHKKALRSADNLLLAKEAIVEGALQHDLIATFLPKLNLKNTGFGSGCHVHLSLWKDGKNVLADSISDAGYGLSAIGKNFMAGVLQHLPAILAFTAPHPNSYERIQPNTWSGAFQCWGHENREAPLRTIADVRSGVVSNFELKSFDGCANPHLGLAAIVAAGLDGLRKKLDLPPPIDVNPAELQKGEVIRLPTKLEEAAECLAGNMALKELLGFKLVAAIMAIRKAEALYYSSVHAQNVLFHKY